MKPQVKSKKGAMPAGMFADGGKVKAKPFTGKDTKAEEVAEAKAVKSGKVSPKEYVRREMVEEKAEGEKSSPKKLMATGKAIAKGKMSVEAYAKATGKKVINRFDGGIATMVGNGITPELFGTQAVAPTAAPARMPVSSPAPMGGQLSAVPAGANSMATAPRARSMPAQSNAGGEMRGLDRAAAMSGREMPTAPATQRPVAPRPEVMPRPAQAFADGGYVSKCHPAYGKNMKK